MGVPRNITDSPDTGPALLSRRLGQRYGLALVAVAMLVLLDQAVIQPTLMRLNLYAPVINVSGRQRMLSQRLSKAALKPIYDRLIEVSQSFGDDVEIVPKKTNVSLRRSKQFGSIVAASQKRIELEIQLPGEPESDRLKVSKGMCSHKVSLMSVDEIDAELIDYLRRAWERA